MGGILLAWLAGEGILVYRWGKAKAPPTPGALLLSSGVFAGLALLGQAQQARTLAVTMAWGYDLAILLQLFEQGKVSATTGWPPPMVTDPGIIIPDGHSHGGTSAPSGPGQGPATGGGVNNAPPGTPSGGKAPPPGNVTFPPGSGSL